MKKLFFLLVFFSCSTQQVEPIIEHQIATSVGVTNVSVVSGKIIFTSTSIGLCAIVVSFNQTLKNKPTIVATGNQEKMDLHISTITTNAFGLLFNSTKLNQQFEINYLLK